MTDMTDSIGLGGIHSGEASTQGALTYALHLDFGGGSGVNVMIEGGLREKVDLDNLYTLALDYALRVKQAKAAFSTEGVSSGH